ncbi:MAG: LysR family transcriptional regulator [Lachnospiraceae bacterium]|nr:LysR family transcriptional regulator [Lachnospiraceae bacterium]
MEIRNLITFVHVAEMNSFTKAAETLGYSQSTISFQIKQLEIELGCLLFERINHTINLTDKGEELLKYAHTINALTDEFMENMNSPKELHGFIHFVSPDSVCEDMLLTNYYDFRRKYPKINLKFTNADTQVMFDMLDSNEADVIITLDNHIYQKDYIIAKEEHVDMHFVASINSPFAHKKNLSIKDIADQPFILTERSMGYRRSFDKELAKRSIDITPVLEIGRTDIITKVLEENPDCISYLPYFTADRKVKEGTLVYLDVCDMQTDIWKQLIYHKNKWLSNSMKAFLEYVKENEFKWE